MGSPNEKLWLLACDRVLIILLHSKTYWKILNVHVENENIHKTRLQWSKNVEKHP